MSQKLTLAPPGVHLVCRGCTYKFSLWITPKKIFSARGGAGAATAPPGYAYVE